MRDIEFKVATSADDPDVRQLLRDNPMPGEISLSLEREPDMFLASATEGERHHTIVARDGSKGRPVGMASRSVYRGFVNGTPCRIGYLSQLRVARAYRGRVGLLSGGYALMRSLRNRDELSFDLTTVIADNRTARRVLGAGLPGLPIYQEIEPFITLVVPVWRPRKATPPDVVQIERGSLDTIDAIVDCLERNRARAQFAPFWTSAELLSCERSRGLAPGDFFVARRGPRVVGCLALWDQSGFKQVVVRSYGPRMRRRRPWVELAARLAGTPRLPEPGQPMSHLYLSHVGIDDDAPDVFGALFSEAYNDARARGHGYVVVGFAERHPLLPVLRRQYRAWRYTSILYGVTWDSGPGGPRRD